MTAKIKVLITAVGGDIGQSVARVLKGRFDTVGCDMSDVPYSSHFVDKFYQIPSAGDAEQYLSALADIVSKEKIDIVCPVSEPEILAMDQNRQLVAGWPCKILLNNERTVRTFADKLATANFFTSLGFAGPKTVDLSELEGRAWSYPYIVKDKRGCGSTSVWIVKEDADLAYVKAKNNGRFIAQEYLAQDDQEFTTGVFSDGKKTASITFRRHLGFGGLSREVELVQVPYLSRLAEDIALEVGLCGAINIQSRKVGDQYLPFEINPRISSTVFFRFRFGFDDVGWWINALNGADFEYSPRYSSGRAFRYLEDCFVGMQEV
jgi:carbamoyl-phosphate synthase large subunit